MTQENEDINVTVDEEQVSADDGQLVVAPEPQQEQKTEAKPAAEPSRDDLVAQFEAKIEQERKARIAAEQRAQSAHVERDRATAAAQTAQDDLAQRYAAGIDAELASAESDAKAGELEYQRAFEAGDAAGMASAQRKMARAESRSTLANEKKTQLTQRRETQPAAEGRVDTSGQDPIEQFINGRTQATATWLRDHKEWLTDTRKNAKLQAAHFSAVGDGIAPDTPEYFEAVETFIGLRQAAESNGSGNGKVEVKAHARSRPTPVTAPVQASGGGTSGSGGNEVRLTRGEATAATDGTHTWNYDDPSQQKRFKKGDPIGVQEFARRKLEMTKQGHYDRSYVNQ